jgi:hypothetical protein
MGCGHHESPWDYDTLTIKARKADDGLLNGFENRVA